MHDTRRAGRRERRAAPATTAADGVGYRSTPATAAAEVAPATTAATNGSEVPATQSTLIRRAIGSGEAARGRIAPEAAGDLSASPARARSDQELARIGVQTTAGAAVRADT
jgi:hypothetical protein